jgi:hypothetical protein
MASIDGSITGHGADLLIFDDPVDIDKANDLEHLREINSLALSLSHVMASVAERHAYAPAEP